MMMRKTMTTTNDPIEWAINALGTTYYETGKVQERMNVEHKKYGVSAYWRKLNIERMAYEHKIDAARGTLLALIAKGAPDTKLVPDVTRLHTATNFRSIPKTSKTYGV